ncbi:Ribosomal protein L1 [Penicillium brevicompactum]|uniref:Ribosomal protein L1 n=1 Tax=Penicillium brevicompactum TaxID=5074 RepID=A0A9W9Q2U9_PENBR|nr:Ribosomal protein L1 [Penicillium brevicompactum]
MGSSNTQLTSKVTSGSPYQLDKPQALKASTALLKHIKSTQQEQEKTATKKTLIGDNDSDDEDAATKNEAVWLVLTTKQHVVDKNRLKPGKIAIPHSLNTSPSLSICLITADPQRGVKDIIADSTFPQDLSSRIEKVIGFSKLKARYQSFESRRQLFSEHDVFLADDRIAMRLVQTLGKIFYKSSKRPIPIRIAEIEKVDGKRVKKEKKRPNVPTDKDIKHASFASPLIVAKEIERTLNCASVQLAPSTTAAVRVGSSKFTPEQLSENVAAVVKGLTDKFVAKGWRNIKALHIKGANTMALPIWLADELWVEDSNVLEAAPETDAANFPKKRKAVTDGKALEEKKTKKTKSAEDEEEAASVAARKEKLQQLKAQALEDGETSKPEAPKAGGKKKRKSTS